MTIRLASAAAGGGVVASARRRGCFGLGTFWNEDATTDSDAAGIDSGERSDTCRAERSQLR